MVMICVATTADQPDAVLERDAGITGKLVAELGCDLLTGGGPGAMEVIARSFCLAPNRPGRSVGVIPGRASGLDSQVLGAVSDILIAAKPRYPNSWIEISIQTHLSGETPKGPMSRNIVNVASGDVTVVLAGGKGTQAELELSAALGKPTIVFLRSDQAVGQYRADALPDRTELAQDEHALRASLLAAIAPLALTRPSFAALRAAYSTDPASVHASSMSFPNTCAIRLSEALKATVPGIMAKLSQSGLNRSPHDYMRGAQDLASVLRKADVFGTHDLGFIRPGTAPSGLAGKKGIMAYMNIPSFPDGQGHIDLWDGASPVGNAYWNADPIWFWRLA